LATIEYWPQCIARDRTPVELFSSALPSVERYGQGFWPDARSATTDQAQVLEDKEAAS
jgi:hypothetical protein